MIPAKSFLFIITLFCIRKVFVVFVFMWAFSGVLGGHDFY